MTDLDQLREVGRQLTPPPFESLVATAHKRTRRTRIITSVAGLGVFAAVGFGLALVDTDQDRSIGPAEAPSSNLPAPTDEPSLPDGVRALPAVEPGDEPPPLDAGRYQVLLSDTLALQVDLPQGTTAMEDGLYLDTKDGNIKVEAAGEEYGVPNDACHFQDIEPVGPSVQDLVKAISAQPLYRVSAPEPVEIGGAEGTYLEIRVPADYDATSCQSGQVGLPGNPVTRNNMPPGYVGDWWILDVDGQRVVAQQFCDDCGAEQRDRVAKTVESITFTSTP